MKNRIIKTVFTIITVIVIGAIIFIQLEKNKAEAKRVTELANIKGRYIPVKVKKISKDAIAIQLTSSGFLRPATDVYVVSETQGRITKIYKEKGDYVRAGETIAEVDSELLKAQFEATKAVIAQLEKDEARFLILEAKSAVTRRDLENIQLNLATNRAKLTSAKRQLADTKIKAPVSGLINDDWLENGQFLGGGSKVCNIVDIDKLKLTVKIQEAELSLVTEGQQSSITSEIYPEETFTGTVVSIAEKAGMGNSFDVEISLKNTSSNRLKAGQYVTINLKDQNVKPQIYAPRKAINGSLKDATVYVIANNKAELRKITCGTVYEKNVEILSGMNEGDVLVTSGNYSLYDGAVVKVIQ